MSIQAGSLPYGVVVEHKGQILDIRDCDPDDEVTRVAVWVPDGVQWVHAEAALAKLAEKRDAELIERMAATIDERLSDFDHTGSISSGLNRIGLARRIARESLAVVREHEGDRP